LGEKLAYLVMSGTGGQILPSEYRNISIAATIVEDTQLKEKAVWFDKRLESLRSQSVRRHLHSRQPKILVLESY
jgi:hypothetical protein